MSNWARLGIEKEMTEAFGALDTKQFLLLQQSEYFLHPHITKREPAEYCEIEVWKCQSDNWWYKDLIGLTFFCEIRFDETHGHRYIKEFIGVKLSEKKKIIFRSFAPDDVFII